MSYKKIRLVLGCLRDRTNIKRTKKGKRFQIDYDTIVLLQKGSMIEVLDKPM